MGRAGTAGQTTHMPARKRPPSRVVIEDVSPVVDGGRFPVKRVVGEPVVVRAAVFPDGHERIRCVLSWRGPDGDGWQSEVMAVENPGLDLWQATFVPEAPGAHKFRVLGWLDRFATWRDGTLRKLDAGVAVDSERLEGALFLEQLAAKAPKASRAALRAAAAELRDGGLDAVVDEERSAEVQELVWACLRAGDATTSATYEVLVERELAAFSAWYELFPRSWGPAPGVHGTLADVEAHLPYVAGMGFDILYLPPVHPIGTAYRKGPNNSEAAGPDDPGSPWAIGGPEGGHTAVHPALGTVDDLARLVRSAADHGLELALDVALQCSPDHPWVSEHPEWFRHRPDGTIQYAENPPKKYQDIYPLDFDCEHWQALWAACRDVFLFWAGHGVQVFRVDNPHTKPYAFWEWCIAEVRDRHPDAVFLSEAFARPRVMHRLAKAGFTQSYNYFPWRVERWELVEYFTELASSPSVDQLRPSSWPNTPDILAWHLMGAPRSQFALRALLAATLSPSYGIYGPAFELGDNRPAGNGKEEYLDSEKYQLRWWDRDDPTSLRPLLTTLNHARRDHLALHTLRTLHVHGAENEHLLCFSKQADTGPSTAPDDPTRNPVVVVVNLDAGRSQAAMLDLDLAVLGIDPERPFEVHDLLTGRDFTWHGGRAYVELHPAVQPGHLFRVSQTPS